MKSDPALLPTLRTLFLRKPDRASLDAFRTRRLRSLIAHAYENVPHYRDAMRAHHVRPEDIRTVDDVRRLPILSRRALQEIPPERIVTRNLDPARLLAITSSGSTGRPVTVRRTVTEDLILGALRWRAGAALGRSPRMRFARFVTTHRKPNSSPLLRAAQALGLFRAYAVNCCDPPDRIIDQLRRLRPDTIGGMVTTIADVAHTAGPAGLADLNLKLVTFGGETVTPAMRARIADAFQCPVYETYNCVETYNIAWECPDHHALHVADDALILEILDDNDQPAREGQPGHVVLTSLLLFAMPLIRYRIGDVATPGPTPCPCARPYSTIRDIQGRTQDYLTLPDGRTVHPWTLLLSAFAHADWVGRYQLTQHRADHLVLSIVPRTQPPPEELAAIHHHCAATLGPGVSIDVNLVSDIPRRPGAKHRVTESLVTPRDHPDTRHPTTQPAAPTTNR